MSLSTSRWHFVEWGLSLHVPLSLVYTPMADIMAATNGCGRDSFLERHVPDSIYGLDIGPVCRVHDWMYGHATTREEEDYADAIFGANLIAAIQQKTKSKVVKYLRLRRAYKYIDAVVMTNCLDVALLKSLGMEVGAC